MMQTLGVNQAVLLYRSSCTKCRILSRLVTILSLGCVLRIPNGSPDALFLLNTYQLDASKAMLIESGNVYRGFGLVVAVLKAMQHKLGRFVLF